MACLDAYEQGLITEDTAQLYCTKKGPVTRGIDNIKKRRGEITSTMSNLQMKKGDAEKKDGAPIPMPGTFKLK
jgi:hypothetical protein